MPVKQNTPTDLVARSANMLRDDGYVLILRIAVPVEPGTPQIDLIAIDRDTICPVFIRVVSRPERHHNVMALLENTDVASLSDQGAVFLVHVWSSDAKGKLECETIELEFPEGDNP